MKALSRKMRPKQRLQWIHNHVLNGMTVPQEELLWLVRRAERWEAEARRARANLALAERIRQMREGFVDG
jgi:hypothetical protein